MPRKRLRGFLLQFDRYVLNKTLINRIGNEIIIDAKKKYTSTI